MWINKPWFNKTSHPTWEAHRRARSSSACRWMYWWFTDHRAFGPPGMPPARSPIVMARMDDADERGFVASLARPGGNITGLSHQTGELSGKLLALLKDAVPSLTRVAVLWDATGTANPRRTLEQAAHAMGIQLHILEVRSPGDFAGAFAAAHTARAEGLVMLGSPVLSQHSPRLAALAAHHRLPAIYSNRGFADGRCLAGDSLTVAPGGGILWRNRNA